MYAPWYALDLEVLNLASTAVQLYVDLYSCTAVAGSRTLVAVRTAGGMAPNGPITVGKVDIEGHC